MCVTIHFQPYAFMQLPAFGGAACVQYTFTSNGSSILKLLDGDAQNDPNARGAASSSYTSCQVPACTANSVQALNASAGHYVWNVSNQETGPVWAAITYTVYPANANGEL